MCEHLAAMLALVFITASNSIRCVPAFSRTKFPQPASEFLTTQRTLLLTPIDDTHFFAGTRLADKAKRPVTTSKAAGETTPAALTRQYFHFTLDFFLRL
jgi:hypothetical protein